MMDRKEVREVKEVQQAKDETASVAAFFDLDGTLMPLPSLEQRFFRVLHYRQEIPLKNYFLWLCEALRLLPRGIIAIRQANKMYLRGLQSFNESGSGDRSDSPRRKSGHQGEGQASAPPKGTPRCPVPRFFEEGLERIAWHASQGHAIVLVSGTLEPLARAVACALEAELAARGIAATIGVRATNLEEFQGRWTGRILREAMFGEAKARTVNRLAQEMHLDVTQCWAYGDSAQDRWMLAAVGNPAAVNPPPQLTRIARKQGWPVLHWSEKKDLTQGYREHRGQREEKEIAQTAGFYNRHSTRSDAHERIPKTKVSEH
jgi:HAD superfamily phosphoserine phosphatase-like hydrolase